jgi:hypothetical protein
MRLPTIYCKIDDKSAFKIIDLNCKEFAFDKSRGTMKDNGDLIRSILTGSFGFNERICHQQIFERIIYFTRAHLSN